MDVMIERAGGVDVHKSMVMACVRVPGPDGERISEVAEFTTFTADLLALRDWFVAHGVTRVGMEATGVYWKPVFYVLEDAMETWLLNARHMHNVPGRKTDVADAEWICRLIEVGLVRPSFVPDRAIREIRDLTRFRRSRMEERTREAQRLDKVLQDAGIKLSSVASDPLGVSGRAMLAALVSGSRDPEVLAELAKGTLRKKIPLLRQALEGRFDAHHGLLVAEVLGQLDALDASIGRLSEEIDRLISPFADARDRLSTIPGVDRRAAEAIIGEIGVDMSRFPARAISPPGPGCAPVSTSRRASPATAPPVGATPGSVGCSPPRRCRPPSPRTPTSPRSIAGSPRTEASDGPARPSATRSSSPAGISSRPPR